MTGGFGCQSVLGRAAAAALAALLLLSLPRPAFGESQDKAFAESLFEEGKRLAGEQKFAAAALKLEASQKLDAGVGTLLYLADCYERLGRSASAWATFKEAASLAEVRADTDRQRVALTRASALESKLPILILRVPEAHRISGLEVRVGAGTVPSGTWGSPIFVDPGVQRVEVSAPGRLSWSSSVNMERADTRVLEIPLLERSRQKPRALPERPPLLPAKADAPAASSLAGRTQRGVGLALAGVGLSGLAAGALLGMQAKAKNDDSLEECPRARNLCSPQGVRLRNEAGNYARASNIAFAAGGGVALAGIVVYLAAPSGSPPANARAVALSGSVSPSSGRMTLRGRF